MGEGIIKQSAPECVFWREREYVGRDGIEE